MMLKRAAIDQQQSCMKHMRQAQMLVSMSAIRIEPGARCSAPMDVSAARTALFVPDPDRNRTLLRLLTRRQNYRGSRHSGQNEQCEH